MISMASPHWPHSYKMATYVWMYSYAIPVSFIIMFWQISKLWCKYKSKIEILVDWLVYLLYSNQYCTLWCQCYHQLSVSFPFWASKLTEHSHYTAQDHWLLHFPHRMSLFLTQNHLIVEIIDIHFLLCTFHELSAPKIESSVPFWHGKWPNSFTKFW